MQNQRVRINWEAFLPASHAILPYKVHSRVTYSETNSSISLCPVSSFTSWHSATFNGILPTCSSLSSDDLYSDFSSYNFLSSINNPPQCQCLKVYLLPKRKNKNKKLVHPTSFPGSFSLVPFLVPDPSQVISSRLSILMWSSHILIFIWLLAFPG